MEEDEYPKVSLEELCKTVGMGKKVIFHPDTGKVEIYPDVLAGYYQADVVLLAMSSSWWADMDSWDLDTPIPLSVTAHT